MSGPAAVHRSEGPLGLCRARLLLAALAALAVLLVSAPPSASAGPADEGLTVVGRDVSSFPDVHLIVAAPDRLAPEALAAANVRVVENGVAQAARIESLPADQLEVALVIDTSASMTGGPLAAAKGAARSFLGQLPPGIPVSVISFGGRPAVVSPPSSDRGAQLAALNGLAAQGGPALYDALGTAETQLSGPGARRMVVLFTGVGDTASTATLDATTEALAAARTPLFAVELLTGESDPTALARLAAAAGGHVVAAPDPAALAGAFDTLGKQVVRQYALTYRSQAGGSSDVNVILEAPGVRATTRVHLDLPAAVTPPVGLTTTGPAPRATTASAGLGGWVLVLGAGLCGAAMLGILLLFTGSRTPRARGFGPTAPKAAKAGQRGGLADAAALVESVSDSVLRKRGGLLGFSRALELADLDIRPGELLLGVGAATLVAFGVGWFLGGPIIALLLVLLVPFVTRTGVRFLAGRRRKKFSDQMGETLQILSGSLRAGHGIAQAVDTVAREADSPTAEEFRRLTLETRLGRDFVEALSDLADRAGSEDFRWVVQAVDIQRDVGGDLAEILDTVGGTIRDRTRIRRQVSALSAEGRMSAYVLLGLPFAMGGAMAVLNPSYLSPLFDSGTGLSLLAAGAVLLVIGGLWLRKIVKPTF